MFLQKIFQKLNNLFLIHFVHTHCMVPVSIDLLMQLCGSSLLCRIPWSLQVPYTGTESLTCTHSYTHTPTHSPCYLSLTHTHSHTLTRTHTHTLTHSYLAISLSHTHTLTQSLTHSHTHTLTLLLIHTHSPCYLPHIRLQLVRIICSGKGPTHIACSVPHM